VLHQKEIINQEGRNLGTQGTEDIKQNSKVKSQNYNYAPVQINKLQQRY
jgi:hypothetical protein